MKKKINIFFTILLLTIFCLIILKLLDIFLYSTYGLGKPLLYKQSNMFNYEIKENQKIKRLGNSIEINSLGMRSKKWENGGYKILFFGDSITYGGSVVSNKDLFSEITCDFLSQKLNSKFRCGNYGVNGLSIYLITNKIKFKEDIEKDLIIVTIIGNNFIRGNHHIASQPYWGKDIGGIYPALTEIIFTYLDKIRYSVKFENSNEDIHDKYLDYLINNFHNTLELQKKPYIVLYFPEYQELIYNDNKYKKIKTKLQQQISNFYDLTQYLKDNNLNIYIDGIHLNKKGHLKLSEIITDIIINNIKIKKIK